MTTALGPDPDRLLKLLPSLYRIADDGNGALTALLRLVTEQADALRDDIQQLWDDYFVETCRRWTVPYIGGLVGSSPLHDPPLAPAAHTAHTLFPDLTGPDLQPTSAIRTRADVARTIHHRRRKGTPAMLEELARDITGWDTRVVEFRELLDWNQHLEHPRPDVHGCLDLRTMDIADRIGGPWDAAAHTVDVRPAGERTGWYGIPRLGFFLWRLDAYESRSVTPRPIGDQPWFMTFSPLGQDTPLFSRGRRETARTTEPAVRGPIRAAAFLEDLAHRPSGSATTRYYGDPETADGSLVVFADGTPVPAENVRCTHLGGPPATPGPWSPATQPTGTTIGIDVTRGRLLVPTGYDGKHLTVSYHYGFSAPMGGGPYPRRKWLVPSTAPLTVSGGGANLMDRITHRSREDTVIEITDSATYRLDEQLTLRAGESLTLQAADGTRPHLRMDHGETTVLTEGPGCILTLGGLLLEGGLHIAGELDKLRLLHTTLVPGRCAVGDGAAGPSGPSVMVAGDAPRNAALKVQIAFSTVGALRLPAHITGLWVLDSIVQGVLEHGGPLGTAISDATGTSGPPAHIERSTVLGDCVFHQLPLAGESLFTGTVAVDQHQSGCLRFCHVPRGSKTPQQYRCQPALATALETERRERRAAQDGVPLPTGWQTAVADEIAGRLRPAFESVQYGHPGFAQLRRDCPPEIAAGAEEGSEMGAFRVLQQSHREANLRLRLDEYLPVGSEAAVIHVT
ncbi:hypothetical protein ACFVZL_36280 [Streptomyces sp. NPDC058320]|uniref:hypothetical protein n=1 Tax=unclassified Streptomyces TaxID=2593676 RepID=UPI00363FE524